jgi:hypothetical protein
MLFANLSAKYRNRMTLFWIFWGIDAIVASIVLYFFFIGLADGTVSTVNGHLWLGMLAALAAILGGSLWLKSHDLLGYAKILAGILAIPGIIAGIFLLIILIAKPKWN